MAPLSVLLVNDLPPGPGSGVEVHLARLIAGLRDAGHRVEVVAADPKHGVARVTDLWDPSARRRLRARAERADVVHVHNFLRELSPSVIGAAPDVPLVVTVNDHRLFASDRPAGASRAVDRVAGIGAAASARLARRALRRHADAVLAVSDELADRLRAAHIGPVVVAPPFADRERAPWSAPLGHSIVYAGRLAHSKGLDVLLDAFATVVRDEPRARLRFAGTGPDTSALVAQVERLGLLDSVSFDGLLDDAGVRALLRDARLVCLPSRAAEGLPLLIVEAMLVGRPVVASDLASVRAALDDGRFGVLVPPTDPGVLARALRDLLADDERAAEMGRAARAVAEQTYDTETAVARVVQTYREAIAHHA